jgi:hypothetical protein
VSYQIKELLLDDGDSPFAEWFGSLEAVTAAKDGLKIIILIGGGTKKRQQQDIDHVVALWEDYKRRRASTQKGK